MLSIALKLAQFAPMVAGLLAGPAAERVAARMVGIAQEVTGQDTPAAALDRLQMDPALAMQYQTKMVDAHVEFARIEAELDRAAMAADVRVMHDVNETMRREGASEHWPQWSWRPAIGFAFAASFGLAALTVCVAFAAVIFGQAKPEILTHVPALLTSMATLLAIPLPVLGVASFYRGRQKAKAGGGGQS